MTNIQDIQDKLWVCEIVLSYPLTPIISIAKSLVGVVQIVKGIACSIFFGLGTLIFSASKSSTLFEKCSSNTKINCSETLDGIQNLIFGVANVATLGLFCFAYKKLGYA